MNTIKNIACIVFAVLLISACGVKPASEFAFNGENPYSPQSEDANLFGADVTIDSASLAQTKSIPAQVMLKFSYFQPTPCYQLRVMLSAPDEQNKIQVKAYAVAEKDKACSLMALATPFEASLNLGSFPSGHYSLWLNNSLVGEFDE